MTIETIDADKALALLTAEVVKVGSGYTYPRHDNGSNACTYLRHDVPDCLIGRALAAHGVPLSTLAEWDEGCGIDTSAISDIAPDFIENNALEIFAVAQRTQDNGKTWGEALSAAKSTHSGQIVAAASTARFHAGEAAA